MGNGGEGGIRTHEGLAPLPVFKTGAFNRSATSPRWGEVSAKEGVCQPTVDTSQNCFSRGLNLSAWCFVQAVGIVAIRKPGSPRVLSLFSFFYGASLDVIGGS